MKRTSKMTAILMGTTMMLASACGAVEGTAEAAGPLERELGQAPYARLARVMKKLDLRADQRVAVESLAKDMKAKAAPLRELHKQARTELAQGVRAGKIDKARAAQLMQQARQTMESLKPDFLTSLNKLHAILDREQRAELVDLLKQRHSKGFKGFKGKRGGPRGHMGKMAKELNLTEDQKDQIKTAMRAKFAERRGEMKAKRGEMRGKFKERRAQMKAAAEAFTSDTFDARSLAMFQKSPGFMQHGAKHFGALAETVLPLLTEAQREKLATMIESQRPFKGARRPAR